MMRVSRFVYIALLCLCTASPALADQYADGLEAYAQENYAKALNAWGEAAAHGDTRAMHNLGVLLEHGIGSSENLEEAAAWYRKAANAGHVGSQLNYGRMLEEGRGVPKNEAQAAGFFRKAADQGSAAGQFNLGLMYETGRGVAKDPKTALFWYEKARAQGMSKARARIGFMYAEGNGVPKNVPEATRLLYSAFLGGVEDAGEALQKIGAAQSGKIDSSFLDIKLPEADRSLVRLGLAKAGAQPLREDDAFLCDTYQPPAALKASSLSVCYTEDSPARPGFIKIDYDQPINKVRGMIASRYGKTQINEGNTLYLWNLGSVFISAAGLDKNHSRVVLMVPETFSRMPRQ